MHCRNKPKEDCITWKRQQKKLQETASVEESVLDGQVPDGPVPDGQEGVIVEAVTVLQSATVASEETADATSEQVVD